MSILFLGSLFSSKGSKGKKSCFIKREEFVDCVQDNYSSSSFCFINNADDLDNDDSFDDDDEDGYTDSYLFGETTFCVFQTAASNYKYPAGLTPYGCFKK